MYGLDGERRLPEYELAWLPGYERLRAGPGRQRRRRPVPARRVGRGPRRAAPGPAGRAAAPTTGLGRCSRRCWTSWRAPGASPTTACGRCAAPRRHFVHSKVMAWAGVDRAVQAVETVRPARPRRPLARAARRRSTPRSARTGFDADRNTFTQFYGSHGPRRRPAADPARRLPAPGTTPGSSGTVDAVQRELCQDGFVLRYRPDADDGVDGLPGGEGAFLACTFWLADALHADRPDRRGHDAVRAAARPAQRRRPAQRGVRPGAGRQLGNTPQAFSHVGLVNTARHLSGAGLRTDRND